MTRGPDDDPDAAPDRTAGATAAGSDGERDGAGDSDSDSDSEWVETLAPADAGAARTAVAAGIDAGALVTIFGRCRVDYEGRAASELGAGDRLVVLKPDGTALVHTDEGQQPVNWQPPGCAHSVGLTDGRLVVESHRTTPEEHLRVAFESVGQVTRYRVSDPGELALSGSEADLRRRVLEDPSLVEDGFTPLSTERETPAGAVDVYGEDREGRTVVLELKRRRVGPDAVGQLSRYVDALRRDLHADTEVRGILVAPSVTDRARELLAREGLEFVSLTPAPEG